jgi:uncharacterized protein YdeI (YjbR/CyaY-like superfamily)
MGKRDKRIDAYISQSREFAKPILVHLRELMHETCPDVEETMKWSRPHFMYAGGMLAGMSEFKEHCSFGFWKSALILDGKHADDAAGNFGRLTTVKDLPSKKELTGYIRKAMKLNEEGIVVSKPKPAKKAAPLKTPDVLAAALAKNKKAKATFDDFSPSHRKEYIQWITEAKGEDTRERRVKQAVEWMAEGKARNWKYEKC